MGHNGNLVSRVMGGGLADLMGDEELVVDALRDLMRDEVKAKMREALERNPEIKQELRDALRMYFEAKVNEAYATLKFAKASAKLGVTLMPDHLKQELGKDLAQLLEKEVAGLLEKAL
jgi:predicted RNA binding protein with dsRBD fold (UPF0201 family)